jgi:predicted metal-dependent hydrolase
VSGSGCDTAPFTPEERAQLERGVAQFNDRLFYECHDTLEELWAGLRGGARDLVQGLIQISVGFYHLGNGNRTGAVRLFDRGLERLSGYPGRCAGLDLGALREALAPWREAVAGARPLPTGGPPPIRQLSPGDGGVGSHGTGGA